MRLLVTGFGPYPGVPRNPTAILARGLAANPRFRRLGVAARAETFETSYASVRDALARALAATEPVICLHLGLAPRSREVRVERRAENRCRPLSPDARRQRPRGRALVPGAIQDLSTAANPMRAAALLRRHGIPARTSGDAGAYLCNAVYFLSLAAAGRDGPGRIVLFVHIPRPAAAPGRVPSRRVRRRRPAMAALGSALAALAVALCREARTVSRAAPPA